ncbi:NUDIX hydrolase [Phycisphaera mikurensis]|uniref:GDP-mannose pyrophosphatase n=1 Tax=Phycisphaera mikurensis (strain NBRC 102666 / KCTC 22515 / FYK2301M01) TaxID=1142394 RepID=I0II56_PHYMF|nr:NUDIX hydrolase [Phycisphaera mikurensis]MBB6442493.1 ADP-ribose pyrophosphatase [Phycisphaera mikurensis]BAM04944.1 ADP-ribose pyrophosphatase [Phycisphaera mikurensis NBRC 102666]
MALGLHDDTELIHDGSRVNLRIAELPRRGGGVQRREIAEVADAVVVLPLLVTNPGNDPLAALATDPTLTDVVLIRNERHSVNDTLWELPAGTLEAGEDPLACARRELEEETGYAAETLVPLGGFFSSPGFTTEYLHAFVAVGLAATEQSLDETEKIEVFPTSWQETMDKVERNEIRDAKSVALLLKAAAFGVKRR